MAWLYWSTQAAAASNEAIITANMGLPKPGGTSIRWAIPIQDVHGDWAIQKPEDRFMTGVAGYVEREENPELPFNPDA